MRCARIILASLTLLSGLAASSDLLQAATTQQATNVLPNLDGNTATLSVDYAATYPTNYTSCGVTFQQAAVPVSLDPLLPSKPGQWQLTAQPTLTFADAEDSANYTVLMVDAGTAPYGNGEFNVTFTHWTRLSHPLSSFNASIFQGCNQLGPLPP